MPHKWIELVSCDGYRFTINYEAACVSNVIKAYLSSAGACPQSPACDFFFYIFPVLPIRFVTPIFMECFNI